MRIQVLDRTELWHDMLRRDGPCLCDLIHLSALRVNLVGESVEAAQIHTPSSAMASDALIGQGR